MQMLACAAVGAGGAHHASPYVAHTKPMTAAGPGSARRFSTTPPAPAPTRANLPFVATGFDGVVVTAAHK
jgi:hypothetical protein